MSLRTLEKIERLVEIASIEGIAVRSEWLGGVRGGLVRVGAEPILFLDESLSVDEQWEQARSALAQLDWSETDWSDEVNQLLNIANN